MKYFAFLTLILGFPLLAFAQGIETTFVPLTNIPAFTEVGNTISTPDGLSLFLNSIYKLCIGAAAVLAVLQIMRAGIMYMGGDSVTEKKEAKNLIALSIGGLILVLSPVVVFSIINPEILNLEIKGIEKLGLSEEDRNDTLWTDTSSTRASAKSRCEAQGGTAYFTCKPSGGTTRTVPYGEACAAGEDGISVCRKDADTPDSGLCTAYGTPTASTGQTCTGEGMTQIDRSCCGSLSDTAVCCGKRQTTEEMYSWKAEYVDSACILTGSRNCPTTLRSGGPLQTKAWCERDRDSKVPNGHVVNGTAQCTCDFNIGSQPTGACPPNGTPLPSTSRPPPPPEPIVGPYGWRGNYITVANAVQVHDDGMFTSEASCRQSLRDIPVIRNIKPTGEYTCTCDTPFSQQSSCAGF